MTIDEILSGESKNIEFKVQRPKDSIKYMKTVVAFSNGEGGYIIFGVDDNREVVGIPKEIIFSEIDAITTAISDSCEPVVIPDVYLQTINGKTVIVAEIAAGKQRPYYIKSMGIKDGTYIRVSGTSRPAGRDLTSEMYYEDEGRSYDKVIRKDLKVSDEEIKKLCRQMKKVAIANAKSKTQKNTVRDVTKNVLLSWGLLAEAEDGSIHPTNGYIFLLGKDEFLSQIQCGMFKGKTRAVFVDKREYRGPLWKQIDDAFRFVLRNIRLGAKLEGIYRKDIYELPPDSIRELIINAVMNCSFLQSSHIQVAIYDDRLEITSPGGLMPGVTIDKMKEGYSKIRNRALAHAFSYMNMIEAWGSGIPKLIEAMQEYGLREPEFLDMEIGFRINLYRNIENIVAASIQCDENNFKNNVDASRDGKDTTQAMFNTTQGTMNTTQDNTKTAINTAQTTNATTQDAINTTQAAVRSIIKDSLTEKDKSVLNVIREQPNVTQKEISEKLGWKIDRVKYYSSKMKKMGIIKRVGTSQNGYWEVNA